jgi:DNA-binding transcriptional MocR family regulator
MLTAMPPDALEPRLSRSPRSPPAGAALWAPPLDRGSALPLSRQLATALRRAIAEGSFAAGARLPSTRALAAALGMARSTVVTGFEQPAAEGYIAARAGSCDPEVLRDLRLGLWPATSVPSVGCHRGRSEEWSA